MKNILVLIQRTLDSMDERMVAHGEEVISYIRMLTYAIDFRSESTVIHTITVEEISLQIANILNVNEDAF